VRVNADTQLQTYIKAVRLGAPGHPTRERYHAIAAN